MIKFLFPFLLYFSLSYALIQLGIALKLLSKTSDIRETQKLRIIDFVWLKQTQKNHLIICKLIYIHAIMALDYKVTLQIKSKIFSHL